MGEGLRAFFWECVKVRDTLQEFILSFHQVGSESELK